MPRKKKTAPAPVGDARRYKVVSGVPIPATSIPLSVYPLKKMKVGQCFAFPMKEQGRVRNAITKLKESAKTMKFTIRVNEPEKGRARCWRIA
jgi:hypothetical protein